jgi:multidrug transporter EmrE-like cation transporter
MTNTSLTGLIAEIQSFLGRIGLLTAFLVISNLVFNVLANASFKYSASSRDWQHFLAWQVVGNLAGFVTVITLTWMLRYIPLHIAFPVTTGLAVIGVQIASARFLFGEPVSSAQWLGTLLIVAGIILIGGR